MRAASLINALPSITLINRRRAIAACSQDAVSSPIAYIARVKHCPNNERLNFSENINDTVIHNGNDSRSTDSPAGMFCVRCLLREMRQQFFPYEDFVFCLRFHPVSLNYSVRSYPLQMRRLIVYAD